MDCTRRGPRPPRCRPGRSDRRRRARLAARGDSSGRRRGPRGASRRGTGPAYFRFSIRREDEAAIEAPGRGQPTHLDLAFADRFSSKPEEILRSVPLDPGRPVLRAEEAALHRLPALGTIRHLAAEAAGPIRRWAGKSSTRPRPTSIRSPCSYPYVRVTPIPSHANRVWLPHQGVERPGLRVLRALRESGRPIPAGLRIHRSEAIPRHGRPPRGGARLLLRRQGGGTSPTAPRASSRDRGPPGLTNFGRWGPLPVNPPYDDVVHSFKRRGPSRRDVRPTKGRTVGSEWTKTEAADEAEAATTAARVKCLMRCARTVAKPRRFRLNRTRRGLSTAEIVSQSAGRDGSKIENGKRSNLFPFELPTRRAAGAELVFPYPKHHQDRCTITVI